MEFTVPNVKSVFHGTESVSYIGPKIWDMVPSNIKDLNVLLNRQLKTGNLRNVLAGCAKPIYQISDIYKPTFLRFMN